MRLRFRELIFGRTFFFGGGGGGLLLEFYDSFVKTSSVWLIIRNECSHQGSGANGTLCWSKSFHCMGGGINTSLLLFYTALLLLYIRMGYGSILSLVEVLTFLFLYSLSYITDHTQKQRKIKKMNQG